MPWCEDCEHYFTPTSAEAGGHCPDCGRPLTAGEVATAREEGSGDEPPKVPWHFWVFVAAAALYLGWRAVEGVIWLVGSLT